MKHTASRVLDRLIRTVVGLGEASGVGIDQSFGAAFWIAFAPMACLAALWLRIRPQPPGEVAEIAL